MFVELFSCPKAFRKSKSRRVDKKLYVSIINQKLRKIGALSYIAREVCRREQLK